jgi:hypothetical protein
MHVLHTQQLYIYIFENNCNYFTTCTKRRHVGLIKTRIFNAKMDNDIHNNKENHIQQIL